MANRMFDIPYMEHWILDKAKKRGGLDGMPLIRLQCAASELEYTEKEYAGLLWDYIETIKED